MVSSRKSLAWIPWVSRVCVVMSFLRLPEHCNVAAILTVLNRLFNSSMEYSFVVPSINSTVRVCFSGSSTLGTHMWLRT